MLSKAKLIEFCTENGIAVPEEANMKKIIECIFPELEELPKVGKQMELYGSDNKNISMTRGDSESLTVNGLNLVPWGHYLFNSKRPCKYN